MINYSAASSSHFFALHHLLSEFRSSAKILSPGVREPSPRGSLCSKGEVCAYCSTRSSPQVVSGLQSTALAALLMLGMAAAAAAVGFDL